MGLGYKSCTSDWTGFGLITDQSSGFFPDQWERIVDQADILPPNVYYN